LVSQGCSIVTVTHNHADIIDQFVQFTSDIRGVNTFIVDDHSSDTTADIVSNYADGMENIHYLEYRGPKSAARAANFGLSETESEFVMIVRPTVHVTANLVQQLRNALEKNSHLNCVVPEFSLKQNIFRCYSKFPNHVDGLISGFKTREHWFSRLQLTNGLGMQDNLIDISWCNSPVLCLRAESIEQVGYFDESFPEDLYQLDWLFRLRKNSGKIAQIPGSQSEFIPNAQSDLDSWQTITSHVGLFKYFEKHFDRVHHQFFNLIVGAVLYLLLPFKLFIRMIKIKSL